MAIKFSNLASTTLASGVSSTATSVSVTSASSFPTLGSGDYFYATIGAGSGSEIVKVTGISGTTFTVSRGEDGTTAVSHSAGVDVALRVTAGTLEDLRDGGQVYTAGSGLGLSGNEFTNTAPDQTVSISGSGSTTVTGTYPSFTVSSTSYSHPSAHPISFITGLQTALDGKVDDSQVLTDVPANALFTDTVYTHPTNHSISFITGLQTALDGKVDDSQVLTNVPSGALFTDTVYTLPFTDNSTNWNTAYGWGDHSTGGYLTSHQSLSGYATETYVGTQISNLVDSSPAALNTLNELAAALGDDPNFATTVSTSIGTKLPLAGGTLTGALSGTTATFSGSVTAPSIRASSGHFHVNRSSDGASAIQVDANGVVVIPNNYFYVSASQGSYFSSTVRFRGTIHNDAGTDVTIGDTLNVTEGIKLNGTTVIDASRNLTNINNITSTGNAVFGTTSIDPDSYTNKSGGFGAISDTGWGARGLFVQGGGLGNAAAIAHNGSNLYFGIQNGSAANSMNSWMVVSPSRAVDMTGSASVALPQITTGTISSGAITSTGNSTHGGYSSWTAGNGTAGVFMHYNSSNSYRSYFDWRTLQLGNNGANNVLFGNTSTGGYGRFYVNSTAISQLGGTSGIHAFSMLATGEVVKEANERFTIKSHTNSWAGGMRMISSTGAYTFQIHPDDNGWMYVDQIWNFNGDIKMGNTTIIDSSRNLSNISAISIGQDISGMDTTNLDLDIAGGAAIRGSSSLYFGVTTNSFNSWKTRIGSNNTSTMSIDAAATSINGFGYNAIVYGLFNTNGLQILGNYAWHAGNDGSGSGLDADLLDGIDSSRVVFGTNTSKVYRWNGDWNTMFASVNTGFIDNSSGTNGNPDGFTHHHGFQVRHDNMSNQWGFQFMGSYHPSYQSLYHRNVNAGTWSSWKEIWDSGNDGSGSGLDADLLDGLNSTSFLRSDAEATSSNSLILAEDWGSGTYNGAFVIQGSYPSWETRGNSSQPYGWLHHQDSAGNYTLYSIAGYTGSSWTQRYSFNKDGSFRNGGLAGNVYYHQGNDGSGSGLDADLLDGVEGSGYVKTDGSNPAFVKVPPNYTGNLNSISNAGVYFTEATGSVSNNPFSSSGSFLQFGDAGGVDVRLQFYAKSSLDRIAFRNQWGNGNWGGWHEFWTTLNDGSGSGLDADTVDGIQGASFLRSDTATTGTTITASDAFRSARWEDNGGTFLFREGSGSGRARHLNLADTTSDPANVLDSHNPTGISWGTRSDNNAYYMLGLKGAYNNGYSTYSRLTLAWHTGIEIGAAAAYGGVRFMADTPFLNTTEIMSIGKSDTNVRVSNSLYANDVRAPIFYDSNDTSYYVDPSNYNSKMAGLNLYGGDSNNINDATLWVNKTNNADWGISVVGSSLATEYGIQMNLNGTHLFGYRGLVSGTEYTRIGTDLFYHWASVRAPIFYDSNDTGYYLDPNSRSRVNQINAGGGIASSSTDFKIKVSSASNGNSQMSQSTTAMILGPASTRSATANHYYAGIAFNGLLNYNGGTGYDNACHVWVGAKYKDFPGSERSTFCVGVKSGTGVSGTGADLPQERFSVDYEGTALASGSFRAPIFYDSNDTGYYVDAASTSNINALGVQGTLTASQSTNTSYYTPNITSVAATNSAGVANYHLKFVANNGNANGSISTNYYQTTYATTSDYRAKEDFQPIINATSRLMSLNPVNFQWKDSDMRTDGFLAHEVAEVVSDAVVGEKDAVDEQGNDELQALDQSKLVPLLVKTIQEQQGVIEALEARISALEA